MGRWQASPRCRRGSQGQHEVPALYGRRGSGRRSANHVGGGAREHPGISRACDCRLRGPRTGRLRQPHSILYFRNFRRRSAAQRRCGPQRCVGRRDREHRSAVVRRLCSVRTIDQGGGPAAHRLLRHCIVRRWLAARQPELGRHSGCLGGAWEQFRQSARGSDSAGTVGVQVSAVCLAAYVLRSGARLPVGRSACIVGRQARHRGASGAAGGRRRQRREIARAARDCSGMGPA